MTQLFVFIFWATFIKVVLMLSLIDEVVKVRAQTSTTLSNASTTTSPTTTTPTTTTPAPPTTTTSPTTTTPTTPTSTTTSQTTPSPTNSSTTTALSSYTSTTTLPTLNSTTAPNSTNTTNATTMPSNTSVATTTTTAGATTSSPSPTTNSTTTTPTTTTSITTTTTTVRPTNVTTTSTTTTTAATLQSTATTTKPNATTTTTARPRITRTKTFAPMLLTNTPPPLVQPVRAIESTALSITTSFASVASGAAGAQTLRSMSILGVMYTKERCDILSNVISRNNDDFGSSDRTFPESFLPFLKIPSTDDNSNKLYDIERNFGLASRRGAIVANTFIAPIIISGISLFMGFIRTKTSKDFAELGILAGGRTPSVVPAVIGALLIDGTFCSAIVLLTVPGGPVNGGDIALAIFGILVSLVIVVVPGVLFWREVANSASSASPIECVPSVIRSEQDPQGSSATGMYYAIFGTEVWNGDRATVEKYQVLFSSCRGMSHLYESSLPRRKQIRRWMSMWSFYLDVALTGTAAAGRGWATTKPCAADRNVQIMQFVLSLVAFIYCCVIRPQISPMRRLGEIFSNLLLVLSSFVMAVLGSESSELVVKCSLTAAFIASCGALFVVVAKPAVGAIEGKQIVPNGKTILTKPKADDILEELLLHNYNRNNANRRNNSDGDILGEILSDPLLAPATTTATQMTEVVKNNNNNNNSADQQQMDRFFGTGPEVTVANNNQNDADEIDLEMILAQLSK